MAETTYELGLVEGVGSHFHTTSELHLFVHGEQLLFGDLDIEFGCVAEVRTERFFMEFDGE